MPQPKPGERLKQTIVTESIPIDKTSELEEPKVEFFEYIDALAPSDWKLHDLYVYRYTEEGGKPASFAKFLEGKPMDSFELLRMIGGGEFRFMMKRNKQLIYNQDHIQLDGPRKTPLIFGLEESDAAPANGNGNGTGNDPESRIAMKVLEMMREYIPRPNAQGGSTGVLTEAMKSGMQILTTAYQTGLSQIRPAVSENPTAKLEELRSLVVLMRELNPPQPPASSGVSSIKETLELIATLKGAGLLAGGEKTNLGMELIRMAPTVIEKAGAAVENWRAGMEAQVHLARTAAAQPVHMQPPPPIPAAPPAVVESVRQNPAPAQAKGEDGLQQFVETQIGNIVMNQNLTAAEAVEEIVVCLDNTGYKDPKTGTNLVQIFSAFGEPGLRKLFAESKILSNVPNDQRLTDVITKFIARAAELDHESVDAAVPN